MKASQINSEVKNIVGMLKKNHKDVYNRFIQAE